MADRMTGISLPGVFGSGHADYGRRTVDEMIALIRRHAAEEKALCDAILAAPDNDFRVTTYVGVYERNREVLQEGRPKDQPAPRTALDGSKR